jgi:uncharacterized protein YjbI with pentapeptide repeats
MAMSNPLKILIKLGRTWLIVPGIITALAVFQPVLWPDGFGIKADKSITTTVEKDSQGKITKTVKTTKAEPGKTLWDWLSLLGVPITLAILGYWLQQIQQKRSEEVAKEQRELATDETKEEVLQVYLDRLSTLLVDKNLLAIAVKVNSKEPEKLQATPEEQELLDSAVDVIRARTLSILRRFKNDKERKNSVIRFLIEADFISKLKLDLSDAILSDADLSRADLSDAILRDADLSRADLSRAKLRGADLRGTDLRGADLSRSDLRYADLSGAILRDADLRGADLRGDVFSCVSLLRGDNIFSGDILNGADLSSSILSSSILSSDAILSGTTLDSDADLSGADLKGAILSDVSRSVDRLTFNLNRAKRAAQIRSAKNWESAIFNGKRLDDPEVSRQLGLDTQSKL